MLSELLGRAGIVPSQDKELTDNAWELWSGLSDRLEAGVKENIAEHPELADAYAKLDAFEKKLGGDTPSARRIRDQHVLSTLDERDPLDHSIGSLFIDDETFLTLINQGIETIGELEAYLSQHGITEQEARAARLADKEAWIQDFHDQYQ